MHFTTTALLAVLAAATAVLALPLQSYESVKGIGYSDAIPIERNVDSTVYSAAEQQKDWEDYTAATSPPTPIGSSTQLAPTASTTASAFTPAAHKSSAKPKWINTAIVDEAYGTYENTKNIYRTGKQLWANPDADAVERWLNRKPNGWSRFAVFMKRVFEHYFSLNAKKESTGDIKAIQESIFGREVERRLMQAISRHSL